MFNVVLGEKKEKRASLMCDNGLIPSYRIIIIGYRFKLLYSPKYTVMETVFCLPT